MVQTHGSATSCVTVRSGLTGVVPHPLASAAVTIKISEARDLIDREPALAEVVEKGARKSICDLF